jgi:hypothetical protein
MFQDLFHSDNAKVSSATLLDVLNHDYMKDNKIYDKLQAVGGCSSLVHLNGLERSRQVTRCC